MSFSTFLADNYELSKFVLPKKKPADDSLDKDEMDKLYNRTISGENWKVVFFCGWDVGAGWFPVVTDDWSIY